eukprot:scaffold1741_cov262-Pinguiococcus_pyrenoidosus.AAC.14
MAVRHPKSGSKHPPIDAAALHDAHVPKGALVHDHGAFHHEENVIESPEDHEERAASANVAVRTRHGHTWQEARFARCSSHHCRAEHNVPHRLAFEHRRVHGIRDISSGKVVLPHHALFPQVLLQLAAAATGPRRAEDNADQHRGRDADAQAQASPIAHHLHQLEHGGADHRPVALPRLTTLWKNRSNPT